jgi:capsule polysaccharide export protein KpsE/RkpR
VNGTNQVLTSTADQNHEAEQAASYEGLGLQPASLSEQAPVLPAIDIAWLLWGKRRFLIRFTAYGLLAFVILSFVLPKYYTGTANLMPPDFSSQSALAMALPALSEGSAGAAGAGAAAGGGLMSLANTLLGFSSSGQLFVGVLRSRTIQDEIVAKFDLMKLYSVRYPEDGRKMLDKVTSVEIDQKTGILSISVQDKDPVLAAALTQAYVEGLNRVLATVSTSSARRERVFIEQRRAEVKRDLDDSAKEFSEFASHNAALDIPEQAKAEVAAAADLQAQYIAAQSMLRGLQQLYTDNNSHVRQMKAQVAELESQVNKLGGKGVTAAHDSVLSADELYPSIRQLPLLGVRYLDLFRRSKINEAVYELLSKEYELAKLQEARDIPTADVLDPPIVPKKKTGPSRTYIVLGGLVFSFLLAVGSVLSNAYWKRTDPQLPWKMFLREVALASKAASWNRPTVLRVRAFANRMKTSLLRRKSTEA